MKAIWTLIVLAGVAPLAGAQQVNRVSGIPGESHRVEDSTVLANGDVALAGERYYFSPSFSVLATLSRAQSDGTPLWTLSMQVIGETNTAFGVRELEDTSMLFGFHFGFQGNSLALARISAAGVPIWVRSYPGDSAYGAAGMERDRTVAGEFAVIANRVALPIGGAGQLLRIDTFGGNTIFNRAYAPDGVMTTAVYFNDLDFEIDSGDYYVTGGVTRVIGENEYENDLLVARIQRFSGGLVWCRAYTLPPREETGPRAEEGYSIELDSAGAVHVVARAETPLEEFGPSGALHLKLDPANGNVLATSFLPDVEPAYSSLDRLSSGNLLASGRRIFGDGQGQAQMWEVSSATALSPWRAEYTDGTSSGNDAVEHITPEGTFLTLSGWNYPQSIAPIGSPDQLFIQTDLFGSDGCSSIVWIPDPITPEVGVNNVVLAVVNLEPGQALQTQNSLTTLETALVCRAGACVGDLNNDGVVDDSDFVIFAEAYNILDCFDPAMPAGCPADLNEDGMVDDADFVIFVPAYDQLICP